MAVSVSRSDIRIAILCALPVESQAVEQLFDTVYETNSLPWQKADGDRNAYTTGRIGRHAVVLTYMAGIGKVNGAATASGINATFPNIELALVVGICGGSTYVPTSNAFNKSEKEAIYLGDVVISTEIQQSDFGRETTGGFVVKTINEGNLPLPSAGISALLHKLRSAALLLKLKERTAECTEALLRRLKITVPGNSEDILYQSNYFHKHRLDFQCSICASDKTSVCEAAQKLNCNELDCDKDFQQRERQRDLFLGPQICLGRVSSSDTVKRNGLTRDHAALTHNIIAFEMEAAGVAAMLPTLVVKGVCDYADSHKSKIWQPYAAVTAAACSKALLEEWFSCSQPAEPASRVEQEKSTHESRKKCLASLDFSQLGSRLANISFPHSHTCEWILNTGEFQLWLDENQVSKHNRVLWIKGKPGSGKSTMMKHLYHASSQYLPNHTILSYFFHARGFELERSPTGMLRALLHQLLSRNSDLLDMFIRHHSRQVSLATDSHKWTFKEMESFFLLCAQEGYIDNMVILIDALDECSSDQARSIANFCEDLSINCIASQTSCFICLSIRHFPNIGMKTCIQLNLDEKQEHKEDIKTYVEAKLYVEDSQDIVAQILQKSNHVFLWAVLVVQSLNSAHDDGADNESLQELLSSIPDELHAIFEKLLGPPEKMAPETRLALQLVLYAFKPIEMRELQFLVLAGIGSNSARSGAFSRMNPSMVHKYFISKSHGLLEIIRFGELTGTEVVQFIHESVRDYLLANPTTNHSIPSDSSTCHELIAQACLSGLSISNKNEQILDKIATWKLRFTDVYTLRWVLHHISKISDSSRKIKMLSWYSEVFRIYNFPSWNAEHQGTEHGLLYAIADCYRYGKRNFVASETLDQLAEVLRFALANAREIFKTTQSIGKERFDRAFRTAILMAWPQGTDAFLDANADLTARDKDGHTILHVALFCAAAAGPDTAQENIAVRIIQEWEKAGHDFNDPTIQQPLSLPFMCTTGLRELVVALIKAGASVRALDSVYGTPLDAAVRHNRPNIAEILIENGGNPMVRAAMDYSPIEYALRKGHRELIEVLSAHINRGGRT